MILFFDTETTGLPLFREPSDDPRQPHIVQLAAQLCEEDGAVVEDYQCIVNIGCPIPPESISIHGITDAIMAERGIAPVEMLTAFRALSMRAEAIAGHNIDFDIRMVRIQAARHLGEKWATTKPLHCTMKMATPIVNLPPTERMLAAGFDKPKSANLTECIRHFFDEALDGAHDAMIDVTACRRVYFHLKSLEQA